MLSSEFVRASETQRPHRSLLSRVAVCTVRSETEREKLKEMKTPDVLYKDPQEPPRDPCGAFPLMHVHRCAQMCTQAQPINHNCKTSTLKLFIHWGFFQIFRFYGQTESVTLILKRQWPLNSPRDSVSTRVSQKSTELAELASSSGHSADSSLVQSTCASQSSILCQ